MTATVEFFGETFTLVEEVSEFALLEFAEAAAEGQDGDTMQGMASLLRLVRECVIPVDWSRFRALARKSRAGVADLLPVVQAMFEQATDRPTGLPSVSSDGHAAIAPSSVSKPDDKVSTLLPGRPDLQLMVQREKAARETA